MATWQDVHRLALRFPGAFERSSRGTLEWRVKERGFAWERPLRRTDLEALGDDAPEGEILAVRVPDLGAKEAVLASDPTVFFTIPHFDGYPAVLVRLAEIAVEELDELLTEAWACRAPKRLAAAYLSARHDLSSAASGGSDAS